MNEFGSIIEPEAIPFSFNAPGWYLIGYTISIAIFAFAIYLIIRYIKRKNRREAIKSIMNLSDQLNLSQRIHLINIILKSLAIQKYGREKVASLVGEPWISFLNESSKKQYFNKEQTLLLLTAGFNSQLNISNDEWNLYIKSCTKWVNHYGI